MKGWIFYPVWGLELEENGFGLEKPIFEDATLVTRNFIAVRSPPSETAANVFSGGGLKSMLAASGADFAGPAPIERLIDIPPDSFIAVRRANPNDGAKYAASIRALLTSSAALTSGVAKGFSMTPLALHWAAVPARVMLDGKGRLQTRYSVVASNFIHMTPVRVTHKALREAWQTGTAIQGSWRMSKDDVLSKALVGDWGSLSGLRKRIRSCASTLARAMESPDMTVSTLHAVAALEMLLKDGKSDFRELEEIATAVFAGPNGPPEMKRLLKYRHQIAHEAGIREDHKEHSLEIGAAWVIMVLAAHAAEHVSSVDEFLAHLRGRVRARRVAQQFREQGEEELAEGIERVATMFKVRQ